MIDRQKTYELIDSYLRGKLQGSELRSFEQQIASDSALASEVENFRIADQILIEEGLRQEKLLMQQVDYMPPLPCHSLCLQKVLL